MTLMMIYEQQFNIIFWKIRFRVILESDALKIEGNLSL